MTAIAKTCGTVVPRQVIYKIAQHTGDDVYLSYEHYGSFESAVEARLNLLAENPDHHYTVEQYRIVGN